MTKRILRVLAVAILLPMCSPTALAGPDGPKATGTPLVDSLAGLPAGAVVSDAAIRTITRHIEFWLNVIKGASIKDARASVAVSQAPQMLQQGFMALRSASYQYEYAKIYAAKVPPLLKLTDKLHLSKEISVARVAALLKQPTIEPALSLMSSHKNPGGRYWAARGYYNVGAMLLDQPGMSRKMLATLAKMGQTESSGPVLGEVLVAACGSAEVVGANAAKLRAPLAKIWLARLQGVYAGKVETIDAFRKATEQLKAAKKDDQQTALQLIADALEAVSKGLDLRANQADDKVWEALSELIVSLERRYLDITGQKLASIKDILGGPDPRPIIAARVRLAVNGKNYKGYLKKNLNITPRFKAAPIPAPIPATQPAK